MEDLESAKTLGLDIHVLADGGPENKVQICSFHIPICAPPSVVLIPRVVAMVGMEYGWPETRRCQHKIDSQPGGQAASSFCQFVFSMLGRGPFYTKALCSQAQASESAPLPKLSVSTCVGKKILHIISKMFLPLRNT